MDTLKTAREIGFAETAINIAKVCNSVDIVQKVGASMPLPSENIASNIKTIAEWLLDFNKNKYMFLVPEIAIIEEMGKLSDKPIEVIIAIPCDMDEDAKERLKNNLPHTINVSILEEPYFPQSFYPGNGLIVVSGYLGGERAMVLPDTYRMFEHYNGFLGRKVFVPYIETNAARRYNEWMEISSQNISAKWRESHE